MPPTLVRTDLLEDPTLRGRSFVEAHTERVETWLTGLFHEAGGSTPDRPVALVALGGQGRRELAPQSDLDLLLLHEGREDPGTLAEALWYPIWDEGLKLGHSVRTVRETLSLASSDLETATALLSARHICGAEELTLRLRERARANWVKRGRRWVEELSAAVKERHGLAGDVAFALAPDLKEGRGGMRDVHALGWAIAAGEPVEERLVAGLVEPYDELLEVRVELHRIQGQPGDVLVLQEQDAVAAALGLRDADVLMERVASAGRRIAEVSDEAWYDLDTRHASQGLVLRRRDRKVADDLVSRHGRVALVDEMRPPSDPFACLEVALVAAREGQRISHSTLNALVGGPPPPEGVWPEVARKRFVELLLTGRAAVEVIEVLAARGLWSRLLPEWRPAVSRPQRNAYHRFTVDRHLLECAALAAERSDRVSRPDLLVMAALLHDIGKAYPELGDHSEHGAPIAAAICSRMGFDDGDAETVAVLVRHHLLLADVATRRDLSDPATAEHVARVLGTVERVELLQVLTEADSLATGPSAWSPWKSDLVQRLAWSAGEVLGAPAGTRRGAQQGSAPCTCTVR
ncbi:MAG: HD domain-containing protein [Microthrixaceae bacterium]